MAAKPPGGGGPIPPRAPAAPRAPVAVRPVGPQGPRAPAVPIAPPTPKVSVVEAAAAVERPRPPSTPDDWDSTDVTRPHDMMLSRDDVRAIVEQATSTVRVGQDDIRLRLSRIEERLTLLERSALTPVAPAVRSPPPAPVTTPVLVTPAAVAAPVPVAPAPVVAPVAVAPVVAAPTSDPFGAVVVQQPRRAAPVSVDLSPDEIPFDGSKRRRRITVVVLMLLLITVGTFVGIAMTSQMRAGH